MDSKSSRLRRNRKACTLNQEKATAACWNVNRSWFTFRRNFCKFWSEKYGTVKKAENLA